MIKIENLSKKYAEDPVLDIDAMEIPSGEIFGLVGNNGAGKTTLFSLLLDLIMPSNGKVLNNGVQVNVSEDWKPFTAAFIDESFLIGYLTPEEYFYFIGELRGMNKQDVSEFLVPFEDFFHGEILGGKKYLRDLSKGNQKKVGIVASFLGHPKVIILDEPFANLDPTTQIRLKKIIAQYKDDAEVTLLISSHDLLHVTEVCQRIVVLDKGKVVRDTKTSNATLKELEGFFAEEIQSTEGE
ncbi:ABC transporter ATP-binding protein [Echinicola soli]|uniref:ABC transporter ATP-binding protein n=1 Tax=Echinicola soli TaxID=2591634 RepID=A0A514CI60_9BACT|nr:ABC transporter ATP-binding protein [Echinicola soli]QDH79511.1 ABC transporter ATP-binding protein [Echinicola soli]